MIIKPATTKEYVDHALEGCCTRPPRGFSQKQSFGMHVAGVQPFHEPSTYDMTPSITQHEARIKIHNKTTIEVLVCCSVALSTCLISTNEKEVEFHWQTF